MCEQKANENPSLQERLVTTLGVICLSSHQLTLLPLRCDSTRHSDPTITSIPYAEWNRSLKAEAFDDKLQYDDHINISKAYLISSLDRKSVV